VCLANLALVRSRRDRPLPCCRHLGKTRWGKTQTSQGAAARLRGPLTRARTTMPHSALTTGPENARSATKEPEFPATDDLGETHHDRCYSGARNESGEDAAGGGRLRRGYRLRVVRLLRLRGASLGHRASVLRGPAGRASLCFH